MNSVLKYLVMNIFHVLYSFEDMGFLYFQKVIFFIVPFKDYILKKPND